MIDDINITLIKKDFGVIISTKNDYKIGDKIGHMIVSQVKRRRFFKQGFKLNYKSFGFDSLNEMAIYYHSQYKDIFNETLNFIVLRTKL